MPNFRYIFRLVSTFLTKFKPIILIAVLLGIGVFYAIGLIIPSLGSSKTERVGITGRFTPTSLPPDILNLIGDGLTKVSPSGDVEPNIASSWQTPDRGKTWIFTIKQNLFWQDGKKVTSETVNYEFSDLETEKPDAQTLVFKLQNPYSPFPVVVSTPIFKKGLLGTGDWRVKKISLSGGFVSAITLSDAKKNKKIYKFYPTEERAKIAFELGEVDKISDIHNPSPLDSWKRIKTTKKTDSGEYVALFFNTQDKSLSEKNLRQALAYGIDKNSLGEQRAISPLSVDSWAYNPQVKPYNFDKDKAKSIIKDLPQEIKDNLFINLSTSPVLLSTAEKIAKNWEEIGVKTNIQVSSNISPDYQALLAIFDIPEDPDQYTLWHSTQTNTNITKYSNPRIDKLLEDGRTELNLEERKKIYLDFQRFLVEDSPAVFLFYPTTYTISRK